MDCKLFENNMIGFFEGTIPLDLHSAIEKHMIQCEGCKTLYEKVISAYSSFGGDRVPAISPYFYARIRQKLSGDVQTKSFFITRMSVAWQTVAAGLLIAVGISIGISIGRHVDLGVAKQNTTTGKDAVNSTATDYYFYHPGEIDLADNLLINE
jgi:hypothetical protein